MKISTILDHIDSGHMALPEFQRGYVWNRDQVRALMYSLYKRHPIGSLLVWVTESKGASHRGDQDLAPGIVKLLLDGQQRMTTLYGIARGKPPEFFDGNSWAFTGLHFHLLEEEFAFYSPIKMKDDPLWIEVSKLLGDGIGSFLPEFVGDPAHHENLATFTDRLVALQGITSVDLHIEDVAGPDKTIDVVVDIFNRVNSGGTKLSKGDLALAKVSAEWPDARDTMKAAISKWKGAGFHFSLDWLLRSINTVVTGEAKFSALHEVEADEFRDGLDRSVNAIDKLLNVVSSRLGLDHDRVLFGRYAFPVMAHYLDQKGGHIGDAHERDKLLFWYLNAALWGRFSGSTESTIDQDLQALESLDQGLDKLIEQLRLWRGDLTIQPEHFSGWSLGARFYPLLYLLSRVGEAKDLGSGLALKQGMLGKLSSLQVHHIFPKKVLYDVPYSRPEVNAVANFCLLTQESNLAILAGEPEVYLRKVEMDFPGALESQWIPTDQELWKVENYPDFLQARRILLAEAANLFLEELLHGGVSEAEPVAEVVEFTLSVKSADGRPASIESDGEEELIAECREWVASQGLPEGELGYEITEEDTGELLAMLDLAWPDGIQAGLSQPVALLIDEDRETLDAANAAGFRYFTSVPELKEYVEQESLAMDKGV